MSCQSLAARAFAEPDKDGITHCTSFHRSVRFSSDSRSSTRATDIECKRENSGSISLTALALTPVTSQASSMSQSAPLPSGGFDIDEPPAPPPSSCRFPKLEECAHFHYERVSLGTLSIQCVQCENQCDNQCDEGWICLSVRSHVNTHMQDSEQRNQTSWSEASDVSEWTLARNREHLARLDDMLHRCIYDRKVSGLPNLTEELKHHTEESSYHQLISDYMHHLSIIADDSINCGPVLNWFQMDNKGHKLLVANEDSSSINTPAVAAAYSVRKYVSQARDEISFEVGDMISIIDMPGPQESLWWRGKRGFRVGFFPHHCVAVIGDKVPRHMTQPPPIVGSVAVAPIKPVLRKHGKLISLFRSFILSRPSRRSLKQQGILRERVFGCDLGEHLLNCGHEVPLVLVECARVIESRGAVDGVYRLSGGSGLTQRLRAAFDSGTAPDLSEPLLQRDPHAVPSLLKMYFRELPNPLCTYQLYESFVSAVQQPDEMSKLRAVRDTVVKLPPPHYRTLAYLMRHLSVVSLWGARTGMTARNMAIVWAPNLLRAPHAQHALQGVAVQAVVTEFLICYAEELFSQEQGADSGPDSLEQDHSSIVELRGGSECGRRPKSLPINPPTKLLSLEEARRRGLPGAPALSPAPQSAPAPSSSLLRPVTQPPRYIEVGNGPNNLPQYHTVLDLPLSGNKRGLKRSPSGWRGIFTRTKHRMRTQPEPVVEPPAQDIPMPGELRPVKSCESLTSDTDTLAPLNDRIVQPLKHHTRSSSCDSYFEPWQAELADMRLRLAPQERDHHMFTEEDDTLLHAQNDSVCSTPVESELCSVEPSPRKNLRVDVHAANEMAESISFTLEEQLSQLGYIDSESPRARAPPEKRHSHNATHADIPKRLCKDRDSPKASQSDFQTSISNVKLRDRTSPRKTRNNRYSTNHDDKITTRLSWHGKDGHSTLIKIDWPVDTSVSNLTTSTLTTPVYDQLETDSDTDNKQTIKISNDCLKCDEKCLKCELKAANYENVESLSPNSDISYKNLNRLSAVSTSSSDHNSDKKNDLKVMTSSHESSSKVMTSSHESSSSCEYNFARPNYINLSSSSKSSPGSPLKSPLKSTISITFRSPKVDSERDSVYENIDLEKNLSIVENAIVPETDASLPTQDACQPNDLNEDYNNDLIILETPTKNDDIDVYSQVKFFKKSIEEVNAMILESPEKDSLPKDDGLYENLEFDDLKVEQNNLVVGESDLDGQTDLIDEQTDLNDGQSDLVVEQSDLLDGQTDLVVEQDDLAEHNNMKPNFEVDFHANDYENINVDTLKICDGKDIPKEILEHDNGNVIKKESKNLNVRELAIRFESPTEQKGPFTFEKFKADIKYPSLERKNEEQVLEIKEEPKSYKLTKNSARSLDENAFVKEFGDKDRRKSMEVKEGKKKTKYLPDLNLNPVKNSEETITPTTENKISLIQFNERPTDIKQIINFDTEKKLSRERIEKYKEERRNFLREKYSSQSFRSNPEQLTRIKIKKEEKNEPKFERRNTVDLGQRMRFSLAKSANNLDTIQSPVSPDESRTFELPDKDSVRRDFDRKDKMSPSYHIRDMAAMFEQKNQNPTNSH